MEQIIIAYWYHLKESFGVSGLTYYGKRHSISKIPMQVESLVTSKTPEKNKWEKWLD